MAARKMRHAVGDHVTYTGPVTRGHGLGCEVVATNEQYGTMLIRSGEGFGRVVTESEVSEAL